ncbi:hypothetical protein T4D_14826 [Trichinella pseudospiralis]|uniref:Uncharacterized protein n=1 Tax=Trichinella pseudospiralis TaxID=6337 RepID=A0A0V1FFZ4_TRIPS|nr:hypothetical protein T4D_14826 [Trichinella pseudospiralis]
MPLRMRTFIMEWNVVTERIFLTMMHILLSKFLIIDVMYTMNIYITVAAYDDFKTNEKCVVKCNIIWDALREKVINILIIKLFLEECISPLNEQAAYNSLDCILLELG